MDTISVGFIGGRQAIARMIPDAPPDRRERLQPGRVLQGDDAPAEAAV